MTLAACTGKPIKLEQGMALILSTQTDDERQYNVGKVISVTNVETGEIVEHLKMLDRMNVKPGKYVIKYFCYLYGDGGMRKSLEKRSNLIRIDEVLLKEGEVLYVEPKHTKRPIYTFSGEYVGMLPSCEPILMKYDPNIKEDRSDYL